LTGIIGHPAISLTNYRL